MDSHEAFDILIYIVIVVGLLFAARRLYQDLTRPLPEEEPFFTLHSEPEAPKKASKNRTKKDK